MFSVQIDYLFVRGIFFYKFMYKNKIVGPLYL